MGQEGRKAIVVFLSVYRPLPSRKNKLTNAMFLEQFTDLLESYVACDRLFVVGDLNVHFDNPSDPCTAALNAALGNLSLEQLVNASTHCRGHTLDLLITNRATDVLDLTVADMLLSDHFVISFDLLLRKPGRVTKKVTHVTSDLLICMLLGQIFVTLLSLPLSLNQLTPSVSITHVYARRWTIMLLLLLAQ